MSPDFLGQQLVIGVTILIVVDEASEAVVEHCLNAGADFVHVRFAVVLNDLAQAIIVE